MTTNTKASHSDFRLACPIPIKEYPAVQLAHGGGGRLMHQLIERMFRATLCPDQAVSHDSAIVHCSRSKIAFTTDSYVVHPLFFPGGDIGMLAVNGTVNDLAMAGARPISLSLGLILEEGLLMEDLWWVVLSIRDAARKADVCIVTGDTKVVDKGKGDGIFINTSGIGVIEHDFTIAPQSVQKEDVIIVNGDIARHGMAVMAVREGLEFESAIESDSVPLAGIVGELLKAGIRIHCLRDLTRGGMASALNEISESAHVEIEIEEARIPVREDVASACEMLGFDPLYVANEGRFVAFVAPRDAERALTVMTAHPDGQGASLIGKVTGRGLAGVHLRTKIGSSRIVDMLSGEQLPRIC